MHAGLLFVYCHGELCGRQTIEAFELQAFSKVFVLERKGATLYYADSAVVRRSVCRKRDRQE